MTMTTAPTNQTMLYITVSFVLGKMNGGAPKKFRHKGIGTICLQGLLTTLRRRWSKGRAGQSGQGHGATGF